MVLVAACGSSRDNNLNAPQSDNYYVDIEIGTSRLYRRGSWLTSLRKPRTREPPQTFAPLFAWSELV